MERMNIRSVSAIGTGNWLSFSSYLFHVLFADLFSRFLVPLVGKISHEFPL